MLSNILLVLLSMKQTKFPEGHCCMCQMHRELVMLFQLSSNNLFDSHKLDLKWLDLQQFLEGNNILQGKY